MGKSSNLCLASSPDLRRMGSSGGKNCIAACNIYTVGTDPVSGVEGTKQPRLKRARSIVP